MSESLLPVGVKNQQKMLAEGQEKFKKLCEEAIELGNAQQQHSLMFYWKLGQQAGIVRDNPDGSLLNAAGEPATLADFEAETGYKRSMLNKVIRFAQRFTEAQFKRLCEARIRYPDGKERAFSWAHIDALLSLGPDQGDEIDRMIERTINEGMTALQLVKEVRQLKPPKTSDSSTGAKQGRPVIPKKIFTRVLGRATNLADDLDALDEILDSYSGPTDDLTEIESVLKSLNDKASQELKKVKTLLKKKKAANGKQQSSG